MSSVPLRGMGVNDMHMGRGGPEAMLERVVLERSRDNWGQSRVGDRVSMVSCSLSAYLHTGLVSSLHIY